MMTWDSLFFRHCHIPVFVEMCCSELLLLAMLGNILDGSKEQRTFLTPFGTPNFTFIMGIDRNKAESFLLPSTNNIFSILLKVNNDIQTGRITNKEKIKH